MAWVSFENGKGETWAINRDGLWLLAKAYARSEFLLATAKISQHDEHLGFFISVTVRELDVPWPQVEAVSRANALSFCHQALFRRDKIGEETIDTLVHVREATARAIAIFARRAKQVSDANAAAFQQLDSGLEQKMFWAKTLRDVDLQAFLVVAGFASDGVAWTALGLGSGASGVYEYQDTHNLAGSIATAAGTFVVGAIPLGGEALGDSAKIFGKSVSKQVIVIGASSVATGAKDLTVSWVEGKKAGASVKTALVDAGLTALTGPLGDKIDRLALPIKTTLDTGIGYGIGQISSDVGESGADDFAHAAPSPRAFESHLCPISATAQQDDRQYIRTNVLKRVA